MRLKVSTSSAYCEGTKLLPYNKGGLDLVEVGLDQNKPQRAEPQKAVEACVWVQGTDPPLKMTHIWTSLCVCFCLHVF